MDSNKNKTLDRSELDNGLRMIGVNLNEEQIEVLMSHFDKDNGKNIHFDELLVGLRGDLNESRLALI